MATTAPGAPPSRRQLGVWICTALVVGNMIGSGVFLLPASLGSYGGISIVGWVASTGGALALALVFARLSRMVPRTGGPYVFARQGFGDLGGFLVAWSYWISIWTTNAALAVAFVSYLTVFVPTLATTPMLAAAVALAAIWGLTAVNAAGVRSAGAVQLVTTVIKLVPLIAISTLGLLWFNGANFQPFNASGQPAIPAVSATVTLTLWAFLGLESGTVPAENVVDPERTIPRATVLGTLIASAVYIMGTIAVMGIIAPAQLATSPAPFADAARSIWGSWGGYLLGAGAVVSCFGALNGWILLSSQIPFAAARDGLLPSSLARVSSRGIPLVGLMVSSIVATALTVMNYTRGLVEAFTFLIVLATLATLVPYVFASLAALVISARERAGHRAAAAGTWLLALGAFGYALWAIAGAGRDAVYWGFLLIIGGLPVYAVMMRHRRRGETG
jgi:APA family basic amino acid/polyamine antiporter